MSCIDICLLTLLGTSAKQNHQPLPVLAKINSIARPKIQSQFRDPGAHGLRRREVAILHTKHRNYDPGACASVELQDPIPVRNSTARIDIFTNFNHSPW